MEDGIVNTDKLAANAVTTAKITDGTIAEADIANDAVTADKIANAVNSAISANTSKTTNATHSGEVTGSGALTIADNIVDEANLKVSNSPVNGYNLVARSGNTGGMTWEESAGGGKILQVISTTKTDTFSTSTSPPSYASITGLTATITPSASNSKILVMVSIGGFSNSAQKQMAFNLVRGSTSIFQGNARSGTSRASAAFSLIDGGNGVASVSYQFLDSPSSTSELNYTAQIGSRSGGTAFVGGTQATASQDYDFSTPSTITVMEIGA
tara:strand:+ start:70 stop:876 length:807 start_codon:yes stop_codon:yes gene_type:complete